MKPTQELSIVTWTDPPCGACAQFAILFMSMLKPEEQNGARLSILQIHTMRFFCSLDLSV
jgi:hypothetical protein